MSSTIVSNECIVTNELMFNDRSKFRNISLSVAKRMIKNAKRATPATAWMDMLFMANENNPTYIVLGKEYQANRGQIIVNAVELSVRWRWGVVQVLVFLCMLRGDGLIKVKDVNIFGCAEVITINIPNIEKQIFDGTTKGGSNG